MVSPTIVIIGAGSTEFTPGLLADLVSSPELRTATVKLVDIDPWAVETMVLLGERLNRDKNAALTISGTTDRREALPGADFVTTTIAVGGVKGWELDVRVPEKFGVFQTVGDSVGPGGVMRALRHVPEIVSMARDMEELCPDAWLFNYTNPMSAIVRGVQKSTSINCVGLCHGVLHTRELMARDLGVDHHDLNVVFAGVNHLCWLLDARHAGRDVYDEYRAFLKNGLSNLPDEASDDPYERFQIVCATLADRYGYFPSPGDRHVAEFFPYFLRPGDDGKLMYGTQYSLDMTNQILWTKDTTREEIREQAVGDTPLDAELTEDAREGERLIHIIDAIVNDRRMPELAVNVRNDGLIPNLPEWAVVEVPGQISGFGVSGIGVGAMPDGPADVVRHRIYQQELTVNAALSGSRSLAIQAMLADPLMTNASCEAAEEMFDAMLAAHAEQGTWDGSVFARNAKP